MSQIHLVMRPGFTIAELIVTVSILAVMAAVATLAVRPVQHLAIDDPLQILADSQRSALATGRTITVRLRIDGTPESATIHPAGDIIADSLLGIERLTGIPANARR